MWQEVKAMGVPVFKWWEGLGRGILKLSFPSLLTLGVGGGIGNINKNDIKI